MTDQQLARLAAPARNAWLDAYWLEYRDGSADLEAAYERHLESAGYAEARLQEDVEASLGITIYA